MYLVYEYERESVRVRIIRDPSFTTFVAKIQKAKTRKDKDYFVLRATVPKNVAKKIDAKPGDYLFFQAKKAEWFHMLDWKKMEITWQMLPEEIRHRAIFEGLPYPGAPSQTGLLRAHDREALGATSPTHARAIPMRQIETCKPT